MYLLARNDEINRWLAENPLVLGLIFLALGVGLTAYAVVGLMTGRTMGKWGREMDGGMALLLSVLRLVGGLACGAFGLYNIVTGLFR